MLIPRFSLRMLLAVTTACGGFFFIVLQATRGQAWAIAIAVAMLSAGLVLLLQSLLFLAAWSITLVGQRLLRRPAVRSPFADAQLPPQILPPPHSVD